MARVSDIHAKDLIEAFADGVIVYDRERRFVAGNRTARDAFLERDFKDVIGRPYLQIFPELLDSPFDRAFTRILEGSERESCLSYFHTLHQWWESTLSPLGRYVVAVVKDVTRIRRAAQIAKVAQAHQQAEKERLHRFLLHAPAAICIFRGSDHVYEFSNLLNQKMVGGRALIGKPLREAVPEATSTFEIFDRVYRTGEPFLAQSFSSTLLDETGQPQVHCWDWSLTPMRDGEGRIEGVMSFAFDVTAQVRARQLAESARAELELAQAEKAAHFDREKALREQAQAANRTKDEFLAMLGHELRNPLAPMVTALHLMKLRGDGAYARERTVIERQIDHLTRMVNDLLDISRITSGKIELQHKRVEMSEVIANAVELASPLVEQRRHHLAVSVPPHGLAVEGDPTRLAQVLANLLTNAAKYTPLAGHIELSARREGDRVVVSVSDDGAGISAEMLPRVFDLFAQEHQGPDRSAGGLGLGLAIVRSLVERHGGTVAAESEGPGRGSEFTVTLPVARGPQLAPPPDLRSVGTPTSAESDQRRILVVDDNEDAAFLLGESLNAMGYATQVAHDGPSALETVSTFRPQIVLLDIGLPVMDGYEVARRLRAQQMPVRLIAITGYGQPGDKERARESGFDAHLVKPVPLEDLESLLAGMKGTP